MSKIVARFVDGRLVKGDTADFVPGKELLHVSVAMAPAGSKPVEVRIQDLKALFFVKDFTGDPQHVDRKDFDGHRPAAGRRIKVVFKDGEVLLGTTQGYQPGRPGFFLVPADPGSNIERCYVVSAATEQVGFV
jgi:hypothetical protein